MAGFFSRERRAQRRMARETKRAYREERRAYRRTARVARLRVREAREEARLAKIRRDLTLLAAGPAEMRDGYAADMGDRAHVHSHSAPSHHVGPCGSACRAGEAEHPHRR